MVISIQSSLCFWQIIGQKCWLIHYCVSVCIEAESDPIYIDGKCLNYLHQSMTLKSPLYMSILGICPKAALLVIFMPDIVSIFLLIASSLTVLAVVDLQNYLPGAISDVKYVQRRCRANSTHLHCDCFLFLSLTFCQNVLLYNLEHERGHATVACLGIHIRQYAQCTEIALHLVQFLEQFQFHSICTFNACGHLSTSL